MDIFIDEMPTTEDDCPFSAIGTRPYHDETGVISESKYTYYWCSYLKQDCDLHNGCCSGLRTMEEETE